MTAADLSLVDTNVLVYAATPAAPQHSVSSALLGSVTRQLCVTPQIFAEFYSVVTNPKRVTIPFTPKEARVFIVGLMPSLSVLPISAAVVARWAELAEKHGITGGAVFDLQIAVTMLEHGVHRIYTFNRADFERFPELEVRTP